MGHGAWGTEHEVQNIFFYLVILSYLYLFLFRNYSYLMDSHDCKTIIKEAGLKVTPQRIAVLEAVLTLGDHPTADEIIFSIRKNHPNIAAGTVYKTLETLVDKKILSRVKTDRDIMRYDGVLKKHHHLYSSVSDRIEDFFDEDLDRIIEEHFKNKAISNFRIEGIRLQLIGNFTDKESNSKK
mgnify:CR=1 FL=1